MIATKMQSEFVEGVFDYYHLNKYHFFREYDSESDEIVDIPLMINDHLAQALGMTIDEIKLMDKKAAMRWSDKYPFFSYCRNYYFQWALNSKYIDGTAPEDVLFKVIFGDKADVQAKERYDYKSVKKRLINQLKQIDAVVPGTFHKEATITKLEISTEVFFSFPYASKMLESFIDIVNRVESQFFRALVEDLPEEEIKEYDFLVTWLQMTDIVMPSRLMTYNLVKSLSNIYKAEGYKKLTSYVRIRSFIDTSPWRCKEFFDNIDLVRKFAEIFPETKAQIREFSMKVSNFECIFTWSDANPITFSLEEEIELQDFCDCVGDEYLEPKDRAKEPTTIYVPKTDDEMPGWSVYIKQLNKLAKSSSKGGLVLPKPEADFETLHDIHRITDRMYGKCGGKTNE